MFNPFSEVLEKTAPTPVKGKEGDENVSTNGNKSTEKGWDKDGTKSPVATKGAGMETPKTANRAIRSNSMRKIDSPAPQMASLGRARSASNREMNTTPLKSAGTPHKRPGPKTGRVVTTPGNGTGTPGVNRARSNSNREIYSNSAVKGNATVGRRMNEKNEKSVVGKQTLSKPKVKTLDKALRESLSGYKEVLEGKSANEVALLEDAEKRRRESVNKLRNRNSINKPPQSESNHNIRREEETTTKEAEVRVASSDDNSIEKAARRQSVVVLNEFKQLVEAANNEVMESEMEKEGETHIDSTASGTKKDDRRRESMALDQALVRQMLPRKVCVPLRQGKKVPPEAFQGVSIFFSDVVGFTKISAEVEPLVVHELLNTLFTVMDYCTALFPLYKVETIGDAYMVAGGLPEPNENNAQDLADFALIVSSAVSACVKSPIDGSPVQIRMGCHTGNVMAGVVGTLMPRYCLFGDTVNTASRMESNGLPGQIHCSADFAQRLQQAGRHHVEPRGEIEVKGKGRMHTYWLRGPVEDNEVSGPKAVEEVVSAVRAVLEERSRDSE